MTDNTAVADAAKALARSPITKVVGFLICVELASGVLQGYYTPQAASRVCAVPRGSWWPDSSSASSREPWRAALWPSPLA
jgi:hypothetical protein